MAVGFIEEKLTELGSQVTKYRGLANTTNDDNEKMLFNKLAEDYETSIKELQKTYDFVNQMANQSLGGGGKKTNPPQKKGSGF